MNNMDCVVLNMLIQKVSRSLQPKIVHDPCITSTRCVDNYDTTAWWQSIMETYGEHLSSINIPLSYAIVASLDDTVGNYLSEHFKNTKHTANIVCLQWSLSSSSLYSIINQWQAGETCSLGAYSLHVHTNEMSDEDCSGPCDVLII